MTTPVYVKMDVPEELLLSEGVCRQLGIINYHSEVKPFRTLKTGSAAETQNYERYTVPMIRIITNEDVRLLPNQCVMTQVRLDGKIGASNEPLLLEGDCKLLEERGIQLLDTVLHPTEEGTVQVSLVSHLGFSQKIEKGLEVGNALPIEAMADNEGHENDYAANGEPGVVFTVNTQEDKAQQRKVEF